MNLLARADGEREMGLSLKRLAATECMPIAHSSMLEKIYLAKRNEIRMVTLVNLTIDNVVNLYHHDQGA